MEQQTKTKLYARVCGNPNRRPAAAGQVANARRSCCRLAVHPVTTCSPPAAGSLDACGGSCLCGAVYTMCSRLPFCCGRGTPSGPAARSLGCGRQASIRPPALLPACPLPPPHTLIPPPAPGERASRPLLPHHAGHASRGLSPRLSPLASRRGCAAAYPAPRPRRVRFARPAPSPRWARRPGRVPAVVPIGIGGGFDAHVLTQARVATGWLWRDLQVV
jgi:hypothetical protein